jgi:SpoVK/Ycf46/Vps4 family AAA+-type ATPase
MDSLLIMDFVPRRGPARGWWVYLLVAFGLVVTDVVVSTLLWVTRDFQADGPLGFRAPAATAPLDGNGSLDVVRRQCVAAGNLPVGSGDTVKIVAARYLGRAYYVCYVVSDGEVLDAAAIDADGVTAPASVVKRLGAWPYIGLVKSVTDLVAGGGALAVLLAMYLLYYRRERPGAPVRARWWQTPTANGVLGVLGVLPLTLPFRRGESRARRVRLLYRFVFGWTVAITVSMLLSTLGDRTGAVVLGLICVAELFGWLGGRALLRPAGFGAPDQVGPIPAGPVPPAGTRIAGDASVAGPARGQPVSGGPSAATSGVGWWSGTRAGPSRRADGRAASAGFVHPPTGLPTFAAVGGMPQLKDELSNTIGLLLAYGNEADQYKIRFNGILLHGPPGVGKTFLAKATAGEFGLHLAHVSTGDLVSKYVGESATNLKQAFTDAARHVPCLLFFDEFDSIAERRDAALGEESRRLVNQLLQSLEEWRTVRELIIMATTNHLDDLDPAVLRPGRFDRLIRVDLPDLDARHAILATQLHGRPLADDVDLDDLVERTSGRTPATIARVVEAAAMAAFRRLTADAGAPSPIHHQDLRLALAGLGGEDRPRVESWSWDRLILPEAVTTELLQVQALISDPDRAKAYGVDVPSGILLAGPPGTGKTTVGRVFAAEGGFSFYPVTAADLTSKWVGESEATVVRLFERARTNAPAIIFIDEIDAIAGRRAETGSSYLDRTLTQLLTEIDGMTAQPGVFVMAATNRPDVLDPALLRGGRLSRTITLPVPDHDGRLRMLQIFTSRMPLHNVDLTRLATQTDGFSGADLEALCQQAAMKAMQTQDLSPGTTHSVGPAAFASALRDSRQDPEISQRTEDTKGFGTYL